MSTYRFPRRSALWLAAALAVASGACSDTLPVAPASTGGVRLQLRANTTGNTSDAFAKVSAAHVVLAQAALTLMDTTVSFSGASSEIALTVRLQNPGGTIALSVQLLSGSQALFQGNAAAALQRGVSTTVDVTLSPIVTLIAPDSVRLTALGDTARLGGALVFATGDTLTGSQVTWSGGGAAASVSSAGLAIALAEGLTQATASAQGFTHVTSIRVAATVTRVALSADTFSLVVGNTRTLTAAAYDRRGNALTRTFTWQSSNTSVATVNASGVVTGVGPGTATITASTQGVSAGAGVTVRLVPVAAVSISPASANVLPGGTVQLAATTYDAAGNVLNGRAIAWASSDPTVATVSSSGLVTGVAAGSATITATSEGVTGSASITVGQPVLSVSTLRLAFSAISAGGAPPTQVVSISNAGTGVLSGLTVAVNYGTGPTGWITTYSLSSTTAPATLTVGVDPSNLSPGGNYAATITINSNGGSASITVYFSVTQPILAVSTTSVTILSYDTTSTQVVAVTNAGSGTLSGVYTVSPIAYTCPPGAQCPTNWLNASLSGTTAPTSLNVGKTVYVIPGATATVTVSTTVPGAGSQQVKVTIQ